MLVPQVVGVRLRGRAPRGSDRDRPRPDGHRALAARPASWESSSSTSATGSPRSTVADRATLGEHVARVRRDLRLLSGRRATLAYLRLTGRSPPLRSSSSRPTAAQNLLWHEAADHPEYSQRGRARPRRGRAVARRTAPPPGPGPARPRPRRRSTTRSRASASTRIPTAPSPRRSRQATRRPSRRPPATSSRRLRPPPTAPRASVARRVRTRLGDAEVRARPTAPS